MSFKYEKNPFKNKTNIHYRIYPDKVNFYISNINNNDLVFDNLEKLFNKKEEQVYLFSDEGFFINKFSKISRIEYIDSPIERKKITYVNENNEYFDKDIIIDNSKEIIKDEVSQIPYNHAVIKQTKEIYSINKNSNIRLVLIKTNDDLTELYFECFDDIEHNYIKDDFFTLLSLLN